MLPFACPYDLTAVRSDEGGYACPSCGKTFPVRDGIADFLGHPLDPLSEEHRQVRDEWIAPEHRDYGGPYRNLVEIPFIMKRLGVRAGEAVLDAGCGKGRIGLPLLRRADVRLMGLDFSWPALAALRRKVPASAGLTLARADIARMPVLPASFDRAVCSMLLLNVPTEEVIEDILAGLARALKPGGKVIFTTYNYGRKARDLDYPKVGYFPGTRVFIRHYTAREFRALLARHFHVERVVGLAHTLPKVTGLLDRLGRVGLHANGVLDRAGRLVPALRDFAQVLGAECRKPGG
jgi:SAM-dependent methyltransferase